MTAYTAVTTAAMATPMATTTATETTRRHGSGGNGGWGAVFRNDKRRGTTATVNRNRGSGGEREKQGIAAAEVAQKLQLGLRETWCNKLEEMSQEELDHEISLEVQALICKVMSWIGFCFIIACLLFLLNP